MGDSVGRRGIRTGTPVPRIDREVAPANPVTTYQLPPEELEYYRRLTPPGGKNKKEETEVAQIALTKEEYLAERKAGKSRAQIAQDLGLRHQSYLYTTLGKWGIKARADEDAALAAFAQTVALTSPSSSETVADSTDTACDPDVADAPESANHDLEKMRGDDRSVSHFSDGDDADPEGIDGRKPEGPYITFQFRVPVKKGNALLPYPSSNAAIKEGIDQLHRVVVAAYSVLADLLGDETDLTAHVQAYVDRKVHEVTQTV